VVFARILSFSTKSSVIGDLGFVYIFWLVAYTVFPAIGFFIGSWRDGDKLAAMLPSDDDLAAHLWRHVLFLAAVSTGYLAVRGKNKLPAPMDLTSSPSGGVILITILVLSTALCVLLITSLSAPVENYYEHFTRFDHLPWLLKKITSICLRFKLGLYAVLLALLFVNFKKYRMLTLLMVILVSVHEIVYSMGARILALIVLLQCALLFHFTVRNLSVFRAGVGALSLGILFSIVEVLRESGLDLSTVGEGSSEGGFRIASELGSVYFPGFMLYAERAAGSLPAVEWQMFFQDFIALFSFGDFDRWLPMAWFHRNYFPEAPVAPFTLGPIADSAIWGGIPDLVVRGFINGVFFAAMTRMFCAHRSNWLALAVYVYVCASSVLVLKYSIFWHLNVLLKNILPVILVVLVLKKFVVRPSRVNAISFSRG
jgi:hypothetical protein